MKIRFSKIILLIVSLSLLYGCATASDSQSVAGTTSTTSTQTCRKYATNITDTTNSITYNCTFNGSTTLSCTNGGAETITYTYANLQTFVNQASTPVSIFNRERATSIVFASATGALQHNLSMTYNGSGQLTSVTDSGSGFTSSYTMTAWDANNRHTAETAAFTSGLACTGRTYTIAYVDGTTRTQSYTVTGAGIGANCGAINLCTNQQDADGNPVSSVLCRNYAVNATATVCY